MHSRLLWFGWRRYGLTLLAFWLLGLASTPVCRAQEKGQPIVVVSVDALSVPAPSGQSRLPSSPASSSAAPVSDEVPVFPAPEGADWAEGAPLAPTGPAAGFTARAARLPGAVVLVGVRNETQTTTRVRLQLHLPRGLWRVDAALFPPASAAAAAAPPPRAWRMESVLLKTLHGAAAKTLAIAPGETLILRWRESVAVAHAALKRTRAAAKETENDLVRGRVDDTLDTVAAALEALPGLIGRNNRARIVIKAHRALLAAAQAQALWENGRGDEISGVESRDAAFDALLTALSEISGAAHNLVPTQTVIAAGQEGGPSVLRVSLTNAGKRTIPLLTLGLAPGSLAGAMSPADPSERSVVHETRKQPLQTVFRSVGPGRRVSADFRIGDAGAVRGVVQFILGMGAAVIPALPSP